MRRGVWTWLRNGFQSDALMKTRWASRAFAGSFCSASDVPLMLSTTVPLG